MVGLVGPMQESNEACPKRFTSCLCCNATILQCRIVIVAPLWEYSGRIEGCEQRNEPPLVCMVTDQLPKLIDDKIDSVMIDYHLPLSAYHSAMQAESQVQGIIL